MGFLKDVGKWIAYYFLLLTIETFTMLSNSVGGLCAYYWIMNYSNDLQFSGSYKLYCLDNDSGYLLKVSR